MSERARGACQITQPIEHQIVYALEVRVPVRMCAVHRLRPWLRILADDTTGEVCCALEWRTVGNNDSEQDGA